MERQGILAKVNDIWYPVGQVAERLAKANEQYAVLLTADELTVVGVLRSLGFQTSIDVPGISDS